jgi:hypothetical protein
MFSRPRAGDASLRIPNHSSTLPFFILHSSLFTPVSRSGRRVSFFLVTCSTSLERGRVRARAALGSLCAATIVSRASCELRRVVSP